MIKSLLILAASALALFAFSGCCNKCASSCSADKACCGSCEKGKSCECKKCPDKKACAAKEEVPPAESK